jgi:hypothetical protein
VLRTTGLRRRRPGSRSGPTATPSPTNTQRT